MGSYYTDWLPLLVVAIQRHRPQLQAAARQYAADLVLDEATAQLRSDLGGKCSFPESLAAIKVTTEAEIRQYAEQAMGKLVSFDFASISLFELWFCSASWQRAGLPAAAVEVLDVWRGLMFWGLYDMFSKLFMCPDYRCLKLFS